MLLLFERSANATFAVHRHVNCLKRRQLFNVNSAFTASWSSSSLQLLQNGNVERNDDRSDQTLDALCFIPGKRAQSNFKQGDSTSQEASLEDSDTLLGYAIDAFLRGDYDRELAEDASAPHPGLTPANVIELSLKSLRKLDEPEPAHGAAVFQKFCRPPNRGERWGDSNLMGRDTWKEILRGALTPGMLARRIRASDFSGLLDWKSMDVTDGTYGQERDLVGIPSIAYVNVALHFGKGIEPVILQFTLRRIGGVWLIDTAKKLPSS